MAELRQTEEDCFLRLFTYVLDEIIEGKNVSNTDFIETITPMKSAFTNRTFHEIDFTQWKNICAYLYRYGSNGAGLARSNTLMAMRNCEKVENILKKSDLKIMSIGSGPGNDAIGFCSALAELQYPGSLELILVDKFKEWKECIDHALDVIETQTHGIVIQYFRRNKVKFIQAELPGDSSLDKEYFEALKEADVIILSKFFTTLDKSNNAEIEKSIIQSLYSNMKKGAVIFVNDVLAYMEERWNCFRFLCVFPEHGNLLLEPHEIEYYRSTAHADKRFKSDDYIKSKLPVFVFIKG